MEHFINFPLAGNEVEAKNIKVSHFPAPKISWRADKISERRKLLIECFRRSESHDSYDVARQKRD